MSSDKITELEDQQLENASGGQMLYRGKNLNTDILSVDKDGNTDQVKLYDTNEFNVPDTPTPNGY